MLLWSLLIGLVVGELVTDEFRYVTFYSGIKLAHVPTGYRLHSQPIAYGSGSGQQSITAFPEGDDPSSLFVVLPGFGATETKERGEPIQCGETVRLQHSKTLVYLHSHDHPSPLSSQQEVSGYKGSNEGDNWKVECKDSSFWVRESPIQLKHAQTGKYLSTNQRYTFGHPIPGQMEVAAVSQVTPNEHWRTLEGIYFPIKNKD